MGDGALYVVMVVFGIVLAIAWIIMPFAIIGTKPLLQRILAELRQVNVNLEEIKAQERDQQT